MENYYTKTKETKLLNKSVIGITSTIVLVIGVFVIFETDWVDHGDPTQYTPVTSGPFTLKDDKIRINENVFLIVDGLTGDDKGEMIFVTPEQKVYFSMQIDGSVKNSFNKHFIPDLSVSSNICTVDELIGEWTIVFYEMSYEPIKFEIIHEYIENTEEYYEPIC